MPLKRKLRSRIAIVATNLINSLIISPASIKKRTYSSKSNSSISSTTNYNSSSKSLDSYLDLLYSFRISNYKDKFRKR